MAGLMLWDLQGSAIKRVQLLLGSLTLGTPILETQPPYLNFRLNQGQKPQRESKASNEPPATTNQPMSK